MKNPELSNEAYKNLLSMLSSTEEDRVVALSTIENLDRKQHFCKLLLLKKLGGASYEEWKENAPNTCKWLKKNDIDPEKVMTYQEIFNLITHKKYPEEDLQFLLDEFGRKLLDTIKGVGYEFVENLEIKLTYHDHRQKRESSESLKRVDA
jgi:hypothetical protein